jgi:hypothetical protein
MATVPQGPFVSAKNGSSAVPGTMILCTWRVLYLAYHVRVPRRDDHCGDNFVVYTLSFLPHDN